MGFFPSLFLQGHYYFYNLKVTWFLVIQSLSVLKAFGVCQALS